MNTRILTLWTLLVAALASCGQSEPSIDFGKAECAHCRMNVVDRQFGAALVTQKGRQYVFDDLSCMLHFVADGTVAEGQVASWYVCDHAHPGVLIDATKAVYVTGPQYRSPMRGDMAAFVSGSDAGKDGDPLTWEEARKVLVP